MSNTIQKKVSSERTHSLSKGHRETKLGINWDMSRPEHKLGYVRSDKGDPGMWVFSITPIT